MTPSQHPADRPASEQVDAVMLAARVLVGVTASSFTAIEDIITLPQLRVLVMISSRGPLNLAAVAEGLGVHPSNISRACDRLVGAGLLDRSDDPNDRRNLVLTLTDDGRRLLGQVNRQRRAHIEGILARMPRSSRESLVPALRAFADAADEHAEPNAWLLGWTTEQPVAADHHELGTALPPGVGQD
jgi:DNA-binding MarR family transcriptional regulator